MENSANDIQQRVGLIVLSRYDSKRLPGKALIKINGKEILGYIYERLLCVRGREIVIATSEEKKDNPIVEYCNSNNISCFRGSHADVSTRILQCAESYKFDYFVRICGDSVLVDPQIIGKMIVIAQEGNYDFVSNVKNRTFPVGISVEVLKTSFYKEINALLKTSYEREHVTSFLYENELQFPNRHYFFNDICPEASIYKLALDEAKDLEFLTKVIDCMEGDHCNYFLKEIYGICRNIDINKRSIADA